MSGYRSDNIPTKEDIKRIAKQRMRLREYTRRVFNKDYWYIGLAGELAFAQRFQMPMDLDLRPEGDGGIDFETPAGSVDVKTYLRAYNLLREVGRPHADILVLAQYHEETEDATLLGWEYDKEMVQQPSRDFGYGVINHYKHHTHLRPMEELEQLLGNV